MGKHDLCQVSRTGTLNGIPQYPKLTGIHAGGIFFKRHGFPKTPMMLGKPLVGRWFRPA